jgi:hypothetical protein
MVDVDDVLVYPKDALLQNWKSGWKPEGARAWTPEEDTIAWIHVKFQLMDPFGPQFLGNLATHGIPAIGFTAFALDQAGILASVPKWRSQHLRELGLHFKEENETIFFAPDGFVPPSFEKGVLYCGDFYRKQKDRDNKGKTLSLYLDWLDWTPEQIVLVDNSQKNLDSVKGELERRHIPFLGFHYISKSLDPIEKEVARLQYETILHQKQWLPDVEAKRRLGQLN